MRASIPILLLAALSAFGQVSSTNWHTLKGVTYKPNEYDDGDSFHALHEGNEYIFRLYYVDAPETVRTYSERIREQGVYWGLTDRQVMEIGKDATTFTRNFLKQPFTVQTCWRKALGRSALPRHYAIVTSADGRLDLAVELVRNGLGQIYGEHRKLPDGVNQRQLFARLLRAEAEARKYRRGAWKLVPPNAPLNNAKGARQTADGAATVLTFDAPAYAADGSGRQIGLLRANSVVWIEEELADDWLRCRYEPEDGAVIVEFRAKKRELGLPPGTVLKAREPERDE